MPLVRMTTSVAGVDFAYQAGDEVAMSPEAAQRAVAAGWGELVRDEAPATPETANVVRPETPEGSRVASPAAATVRPERRVQRRGGG